jgi:hypothetical protein
MLLASSDSTVALLARFRVFVRPCVMDDDDAALRRPGDETLAVIRRLSQAAVDEQRLKAGAPSPLVLALLAQAAEPGSQPEPAVPTLLAKCAKSPSSFAVLLCGLPKSGRTTLLLAVHDALVDVRDNPGKASSSSPPPPPPRDRALPLAPMPSSPCL